MNTKLAITALPRTQSVEVLELLPTFWEVFGLASVPFIIVALVCIAWTIWLIILTLAPNETANFLMNTEDFDDGRFWMLIDQSTEMNVVVVGALAVVVLGYAHVLVKVMRHRPRKQQSWSQTLELRLEHWIQTTSPVFLLMKAARAMKLLIAFWRELMGFRGRDRKFWVSNCSTWACSSTALRGHARFHELRRD